jgi:hypothetical protein
MNWKVFGGTLRSGRTRHALDHPRVLEQQPKWQRIGAVLKLLLIRRNASMRRQLREVARAHDSAW